MTSVEEFLAATGRYVDTALDEFIPSIETAPARLHEAIRWSVFAGGKRIRPGILFAVGDVFGASRENLRGSAAAIEMIHTYSLIHDDLPSMDDDDLRRGKATCHRQFGEATAILAGDVLQTLAFKAIADDTSVSAEARVRIISVFADSAATPVGMVSGQQLDLEAEGKDLSIIDVEEIHRQKTGALITAAAVAGGIIGGASDVELSAVERYSRKLGLLFQITDDLLDVTQLTETLGKTAGKDIASQKATYPANYGIEKTREMAFEICKQACEALESIEKNTTILMQLANFVLSRTN